MYPSSKTQTQMSKGPITQHNVYIHWQLSHISLGRVGQSISAPLNMFVSV